MKAQFAGLALFSLFTALAATASAEGQKPARYDRSSWRTDLSRELARARTEAPTSIEKAYGLAGVDPQVYLRNRRPEPSVSVELVQRALPATVLFELLKAPERYPFADRSAYPQAIGDTTFAALRTKEQAALRHGLIAAIGATDHRAAPHVLAELATDSRSDDKTRALAALSLGQVGGEPAEPTLVALASNRQLTPHLRASAVSALGSIRTESSIVALVGFAKNGDDGAKAAAVAALGSLGSAVVAKTSPDDDASRLRSRVASALVELLTGPNGKALETPLIEALGRTADASVRAQLETIARTTEDAELKARAERGASRLALVLSRAR